jgi:hypothetical protein
LVLHFFISTFFLFGPVQARSAAAFGELTHGMDLPRPVAGVGMRGASDGHERTGPAETELGGGNHAGLGQRRLTAGGGDAKKQWGSLGWC